MMFTPQLLLAFAAVRRVCARSHNLQGSNVQVEPYSCDLDPDFLPELQPRTLQILFPDEMIDEETLELYFESSKRSGGGDISEIRIDRSAKCAFVTFKDPQGKKGAWLA